MHIEECKPLAQRFCSRIRQVHPGVKTAPCRVSRVHRRSSMTCHGLANNRPDTVDANHEVGFYGSAVRKRQVGRAAMLAGRHGIPPWQIVSIRESLTEASE